MANHRMVYQHGKLLWAFRVLTRKNVIEEVLLTQVTHGKLLEEDWDSGRVEKSFMVAKYFILERGVGGREPKRPVTNNGYFEELVAIDGLPSNCKYVDGELCVRNYAVMKIFEKVFTLGLKRCLRSSDFKEESLNLYIGQLMNVALSNGVKPDKVRKILSNIYKFGFWCGKRV